MDGGLSELTLKNGERYLKMVSPVIFLGMHRSGTSLLGRLLEELGLFVGHKKDENNEAIFFQQINNWLLTQCGGGWDYPEPIRRLWEQEELLEASEEYVRFLLGSPRMVQFLGIARYLSVRRIENMDIPWGWKDPRNTYTVPFWMRLFPDAKLIYIERHGIDVAHSLKTREQVSRQLRQRRFREFRLASWIRPKKGGFSESPRCASLEGGLTLWLEYLEEASVQLAKLPDGRVLKVKYEELLSSPEAVLSKAANFCGLHYDQATLEQVCKGIKSDRAFAFMENTDLRSFANRFSKELDRVGYKPVVQSRKGSAGA